MSKEWEERLGDMRSNTQSTFRSIWEGSMLAEEYAGTSQRTWAGFEVNTGICRTPCLYHDHGPEPQKPPTWPPPLEEEMYQCRLCGDEITADEIETHMCMYIKNALENDDE